jgi:hypothetical protein
MHRFTPLLFVLLIAGCAGDNFDEASIPQDQISTEMAFKRMSDHGGLEPVLEERQLLDGWQFHISSTKKSSVLGSDPVTTINLKDRSGISYKVTSVTSPQVVEKMETGTYGFARGRVHVVERDLAAGTMSVELLLSDWTKRP